MEKDIENKLLPSIDDNEKIHEFLKSYTHQKTVKALKVSKPETNHYHKEIKKHKMMLEVPNLEKIIDCPPDHKLILIENDFKLEEIERFVNKGKKGKNGKNGNNNDDKNDDNNNDNKNLKEAELDIVETVITLDSKNFSTQELLDVFTGNTGIGSDGSCSKIPFPNSFETVGHMAHYNLTVEQIPYKKVIGEITLIKCPNITCVVHKSEKLHNVYRTPTLDMMAGVKNYTVRMKEVGTIFEFDFEKVYWCSRLQQERDRLLKGMTKGECLADIFCGAGPLAVRAARKGLYVIANDLNPYGFEYLEKNCKLNKVENRTICWNMCAREAMKKIYSERLTFPESFQEPNHIYMNLPVDAIEFLDVLSNYENDMMMTMTMMDKKNNENEKKVEKENPPPTPPPTLKHLPLIHVNCFVVADSDEKSKELLTERINKVLPGFKQEEILSMNHIKNVTIIMRMYCITFRLRSRYVINDEGVVVVVEGEKKVEMEQQQQQMEKMEEQVIEQKNEEKINGNPSKKIKIDE